MLMVNELIGFGAGGPLELSFLDSASGSGGEIFCPAVAAGDVIIICNYAQNISSPEPSSDWPSGFSVAVNTSEDPKRQIISYKIANGTEGGDILTGMSSTLSSNMSLAVFRANRPIKSLSIQDADAEATTGNPTTQIVTSGSGVTPLVVIGGYGSSSDISPRTFSPAKDGEQGSGTSNLRTFIAWKIYNADPSNVSIDMDDEGQQVLQSLYVEVSD